MCNSTGTRDSKDGGVCATPRRHKGTFYERTSAEKGGVVGDGYRQKRVSAVVQDASKDL